eukprot:30895-Pelagococcus_subviridis.AAC.9
MERPSAVGGERHRLRRRRGDGVRGGAERDVVGPRARDALQDRGDGQRRAGGNGRDRDGASGERGRGRARRGREPSAVGWDFFVRRRRRCGGGGESARVARDVVHAAQRWGRVTRALLINYAAFVRFDRALIHSLI